MADKRKGLYFVMLEAPGEGSDFIEMEDETGKSVPLPDGMRWRRRPEDGCWELGPFNWAAGVGQQDKTDG